MVDICEENHVIILSDEVHALITYDGRRHYPVLAVSEKARSISIMVFSFSKGFNMMSLPHAMILIPNIELRKRWDAYLRPFDFHYASNSFSIAAVTAIASGQADEWLEQATAYLQQNRDLFLALVRRDNFQFGRWSREPAILSGSIAKRWRQIRKPWIRYLWSRQASA